MNSTVSSVAPALLPFLFAFAPTSVIASYARDSIESGAHASTANLGGDRVKQPETTLSPSIGTKTLTQTTSAGVNFDSPRLPVWLEAVVNKISSYDGTEDGWKGDGTFAPSASTLGEARELASQFATEMPTISAPSVSADDDGAVCFYWMDGQMMATVSVYGDGTYSFYAEGYDDPVRSDSEPVGEPLPGSLIAAMTGISVPILIAA